MPGVTDVTQGAGHLQLMRRNIAGRCQERDLIAPTEIMEIVGTCICSKNDKWNPETGDIDALPAAIDYCSFGEIWRPGVADLIFRSLAGILPPAGGESTFARDQGMLSGLRINEQIQEEAVRVWQ